MWLVCRVPREGRSKELVILRAYDACCQPPHISQATRRKRRGRISRTNRGDGPAFSDLGAPESDCACEGAGPGPYGAPLIATLNDPLTVFVAHNFPDVMAPHHDGTDRG